MKAFARVLAPFCLATLAGCMGTDVPQKDAVTEQMLGSLHARPVGSYALVPTDRQGRPVGNDGETSGHHAFILKIAELKNKNGMTADGQFVQRVCSTFNLVTTNLNNKGEMVVVYARTSGRITHMTTRAIDLSRDTTTIPTEIKEGKAEEGKVTFFLQYARTQDYCTSAPASP